MPTYHLKYSSTIVIAIVSAIWIVSFSQVSIFISAGPVPRSMPEKKKYSLNISFELWCWRRLLRVPWTARRSNQSILKEINPEYSLEGLMLKLQYFGHLMWRASSLEKTLMMGKKRRGWQRMRQLDGITDSIDFEPTPGDGEGQRSLGATGHGVAKSQTRLSDWTTTKYFLDWIKMD